LNLSEFVVISQAAYNHLIDVSCFELTIKHPSSSFFRLKLSTIFVFGVVHTATKIQSALRVFHDFRITSFINIFQVISSTSSFNTSSIFSVSFTLSTQESSALKVSLL
jgi:hypothetical protein